MLQQEVMRQLVKVTRGTKEWSVKRGAEGISPTMVAYRGDEEIAVVTAPRHNRDDILQIAAIAAAGFDADQLGCIFETWMANPELAGANPVTGQEWEAGDMDDLVANHDAIAKGWIQEAMTITAANRAGDVATTILPFRYIGAKRRLSFDQAPGQETWTTFEPGAKIEGYMVENLRKLMLQPSFGTVLPADYNPGRENRDSECAEFLTLKLGCFVKLMGNDAETERLLRLGQLRETLKRNFPR